MFKRFSRTASWKQISQHLTGLELAPVQNSFIYETLRVSFWKQLSNDHIKKTSWQGTTLNTWQSCRLLLNVVAEDFFPPHQIHKGHWNWNGFFWLPDYVAEVLEQTWYTPLCSWHPHGKMFFYSGCRAGELQLNYDCLQPSTQIPSINSVKIIQTSLVTKTDLLPPARICLLREPCTAP